MKDNFYGVGTGLLEVPGLVPNMDKKKKEKSYLLKKKERQI